MEIWKDIEGYEGLYQVSNFGNVRSLNYHRTGQTKVLSPAVENGGGYLVVNLCKNGKMKKYKVHRLVASAFIPNLFDDGEVNHKDEDKTNNFCGTPENDFNDGNLEWCDRKYNINYGTRTKSCSKTVLQISKTGEIIREWPSTAEAGRNGFKQGAVVSCCSGKRKSHHGFIWKYKEVV